MCSARAALCAAGVQSGYVMSRMHWAAARGCHCSVTSSPLQTIDVIFSGCAADGVKAACPSLADELPGTAPGPANL